MKIEVRFLNRCDQAISPTDPTEASSIRRVEISVPAHELRELFYQLGRGIAENQLVVLPRGEREDGV